jgi:hypothetical protein
LSTVVTFNVLKVLLSPVILSAKAMLQEIWFSGADWNDPISEVIQHQCKNPNSMLSKASLEPHTFLPSLSCNLSNTFL